MPNTAKQN